MAGLRDLLGGAGGLLGGAMNRLRGKKAKAVPLGPQYTSEELAEFLDQLGKLGPRPSDVATYVKQRFEACRMSRTEAERDMILGHRFADGQQWSGWNSKTREIYSLLENEDEEDLVTTDNLIGLLTGKVAAILNSSDPDVQTAPSTDSPLNLAAAQEARAIMSELNRKMSRREQMILLTRWALDAGLVALKLSWNPHKPMEVAKLGPDGAIVGRESVPLGFVDEEIVPGWEVYLPPNCRIARDADWLIHATVKDHGFVRGLGPEFDKLEPDTIARGALSPVWLNFSAINQGLSIAAKGADAFSVLDYWHKPGPGLPKGAHVLIVAGEVVHAGPWPFAKTDTLPFAFLSWKEALGQPYGKSLAAELAPLQVSYNRALSDMVNAGSNYMPTLLSPTGAELMPGLYAVKNKNRKYREIVYNGVDAGHRPTWQDGPGVPPVAESLRAWVWEDMQHIAGIHDPTLGVSSGDLSGAALSILRAGDQSQHAPFLAALEGVHRFVREWEIALVAQFALPYVPYVIGLDESGSPAPVARKQGALALSALTGGGSVSIHLVPATGVSETPEGKRLRAEQKYKDGILGIPGSPLARARLAKLTDDADSFLLEQWALEDLEAEQAAKEAAMLQEQAAQAAAMAGAGGGAPGAFGGASGGAPASDPGEEGMVDLEGPGDDEGAGDLDLGGGEFDLGGF